MGTHPIFESDFDCLTEKNVVRTEGKFKVGRDKTVDLDAAVEPRGESANVRRTQRTRHQVVGKVERKATRPMPTEHARRLHKQTNQTFAREVRRAFSGGANRLYARLAAESFPAHSFLLGSPLSFPLRPGQLVLEVALGSGRPLAAKVPPVRMVSAL